MFIFYKSEIFSDSHPAGTMAEYFAKVAHKVAKSEYFFNIYNESESLMNSLSNDILFVGVSLVVQKFSISYSAKVCTLIAPHLETLCNNLLNFTDLK